MSSPIATTAAAANVAPHLIVSTLDQEPYIIREFTSSGETYSGFIKDLLDEIARRAKFTYEFVQGSDNQFGYNRPGGWTGIIGDVVSGRADIGGAALTVTAEREEVVDFTKPFMANSVNLLVNKPTWIDMGLGYLVRPFSGDYWIMLMVSLLLIGIVFFIIGKFSPYEWGNVAADKDPRGARNSFTLRNSYLFALSTLTWQGFREAPRSLSGRIMAAFWWMFVLFSLIAYTANLTAYLLARPEQIPDMPFKSYEDLLQSDSIRVGALNFGSTQYSLRNSRSSTMKALWSKINRQHGWVDSYKQGVEQVQTGDGGFVMLMESASGEFEARKDCKLMLYGENLFPTSMAFAVAKGSFWRDRISEALRELREDGFLHQLKEKHWRFTGDCENVDGRKYVQSAGLLSSLPIYPVQLKDMSVAILLLFLGFIVAMIFLVIEVLHYAVTKKGKKIEKPNILKNPPKIFRPKAAKAAKPSPGDAEAGIEEAGPSSDGLESVPLDDSPIEPAHDEKAEV